jgi:phenylacetate-CoA ligase
VYNQYGSREVGAIACQCVHQKGLHTFPWKNYVEIVDDAGRPIERGEGRVVVTSLENYSMPLIRYEIGDVAVAGGYGCPCGRNSFLLDEVVGRTLGYFKKRDGSKVHSHFIVQALFFRDWIKRFQIVQDHLDHVRIRIELRPGTQAPQADLEDIRAKTQILMGSTCVVDYEFADRIERTASGKYVYTLCQVP